MHKWSVFFLIVREEHNLIKSNMETMDIEQKRFEESLEKKTMEEALEMPKIEESLEKKTMEEALEMPKIEEALEKKTMEESLEMPKIEEALEKKTMEESLEMPKIEEAQEMPKIEESLEMPKIEESLEKKEQIKTFTYSKILSLSNFQKSQEMNTNYIPKKELYYGTVKIHGTHADIEFLSTGETRYHSKHRIITKEDDNHGFVAFCTSEPLCIDFLFSQIISTTRQLSPTTLIERIIISGEFCGQGIQQFVAVKDLPPTFVIFDIHINNVPCNMMEYKKIQDNKNRIYNITQFTIYALVIQDICNLSTPEKKIIDQYLCEVGTQCPVARHFSLTGFGEGIVWKSKESNTTFKIKTKEYVDATNVSVKSLSPVMDSIPENLLLLVSGERLENMMHKMKEMKMEIKIQNIKQYIQLVLDDIHTEESIDIVTNIKNTKQMMQIIANYYKDYCKSHNVSML